MYLLVDIEIVALELHKILVICVMVLTLMIVFFFFLSAEEHTHYDGLVHHFRRPRSVRRHCVLLHIHHILLVSIIIGHLCFIWNRSKYQYCSALFIWNRALVLLTRRVAAT
jgi:hypothetical protein